MLKTIYQSETDNRKSTFLLSTASNNHYVWVSQTYRDDEGNSHIVNIRVTREDIRKIAQLI